MQKAIVPIKKVDITQVGFNYYDFYYKVNETDYNWCICWNEYTVKSKTYMDWYIRVPIDEIQRFISK